MVLNDKQSFDIANAETGSNKSSGSGGVHCSTRTIVCCIIVSVALIIGIGLLAYYVPVRTSPVEGNTELTTLFIEPWNGRLNPDIMNPRSYDLILQPCLYNECGVDMMFRFYGEVQIVIEVDEETDQIVMHMTDIEVVWITVRSLIASHEDLFLKWENDTYYDFLIITTKETLSRGDYRVHIKYIGILMGLSGFYVSSYKNEHGETIWLATSQMQPTDARRALPCWDEPGFRSYFSTTIIHLENMTALSNGIEISTTKLTDQPGWTETRFKMTPKMPTYLLAFVVSDFVYWEAETTNGIRFRVWCRKEANHTAGYALQQGTDIITYFEDYFSIPFLLAKQDMVAVPGFDGNAMENWGLLIYSEIYLLYDPKKNSILDKWRIASTVSHELTHQWFGNLVTPEWWDDIWLNEGFASWVEYLGVNHTEPDWKVMEQIVFNDLQRVFTLDALGASHPVRVPVNTPAEIYEIFDPISYNKGASILRMLTHIISEDVFREGLRRYLQHYSHGNANSDQLWDALNQVQENYDVKKIMDTWTLQMGYPVINMERLDALNLKATQEHFLFDPDSPVDDQLGDLGYLWYVQLTHTHQNEPKFDDPSFSWMNATRTEALTLSGSPLDSDWYLINIHQYGYYRVNYDTDNWMRLADQLKDNPNAIPVENRAALIDDAFALAHRGTITYTTALQLTMYLKDELEYLPWLTTLRSIEYIKNMFSRHSDFGKLEKYMLCQIESFYQSVGFEDDPNENELNQFKRIYAIKTACFYGHKGCLENATRELNEYLNDQQNETVSPNFRPQVYCYGIRGGGDVEWNFVLHQYQNATDSMEKINWLSALSCSREPRILNRYLSYALQNEVVCALDASYIIRSTARNYVGSRALVWDYLRDEYDALFEYYGTRDDLSDIILATTANFNTESDLEEIRKFGEEHDFGGDTWAIEKAIEQTKINIDWMKSNAAAVAQYLAGSLDALGCA